MEGGVICVILPVLALSVVGTYLLLSLMQWCTDRHAHRKLVEYDRERTRKALAILTAISGWKRQQQLAGVPEPYRLVFPSEYELQLVINELNSVFWPLSRKERTPPMADGVLLVAAEPAWKVA